MVEPQVSGAAAGREEGDTRRLTRNELKISETLAPMGIVASVGTIQWTLAYSPVHPSQNAPRTSTGPPIIAP